MSKRRRRRMSKEKREYLIRAGYTNYHHDIAKSRGGSNSQQNLILFDERRHSAFHLLFGNRTLLEAAEALTRLNAMRNKEGR